MTDEVDYGDNVLDAILQDAPSKSITSPSLDSTKTKPYKPRLGDRYQSQAQAAASTATAAVTPSVSVQASGWDNSGENKSTGWDSNTVETPTGWAQESVTEKVSGWAVATAQTVTQPPSYADQKRVVPPRSFNNDYQRSEQRSSNWQDQEQEATRAAPLPSSQRYNNNNFNNKRPFEATGYRSHPYRAPPPQQHQPPSFADRTVAGESYRQQPNYERNVAPRYEQAPAVPYRRSGPPVSPFEEQRRPSAYSREPMPSYEQPMEPVPRRPRYAPPPQQQHQQQHQQQRSFRTPQFDRSFEQQGYPDEYERKPFRYEQGPPHYESAAPPPARMNRPYNEPPAPRYENSNSYRDNVPYRQEENPRYPSQRYAPSQRYESAAPPPASHHSQLPAFDVPPPRSNYQNASGPRAPRSNYDQPQPQQPQQPQRYERPIRREYAAPPNDAVAPAMQNENAPGAPSHPPLFFLVRMPSYALFSMQQKNIWSTSIAELSETIQSAFQDHVPCYVVFQNKEDGTLSLFTRVASRMMQHRRAMPNAQGVLTAEGGFCHVQLLAQVRLSAEIVQAELKHVPWMDTAVEYLVLDEEAGFALARLCQVAI